MYKYRKFVLSGLLFVATATGGYAEGRKTLFNDNWKFHLTDSLTVNQSVGSIDEERWQDVRLPHDWSVLLPFDRNAIPGNDGGYLPASKWTGYPGG